MKLRLDEIYIGRRRRRDYGKTEMEDLLNDFKDNGQITPITVRPPGREEVEKEEGFDDYEGQPWVLVAGGRRLNAAALLGWETIEAFGREEMDQIKHRQLELNENLKRKAMTWQEEVDAKREIAELRRLQNPSITDGEIARELGESQATFSRDVATAKILEKNPGLRKASSKNAALQAGKLLEQHETRAAQVLGTSTPGSTNGAAPYAAPVAPIEERVRTEEAVEFTRKLLPNSVDLMLLDGPYGYNYWKQGQKSLTPEGEHLSSYDDDPEKAAELYKNLLPELVKATRETGWLVFFAGKETYDYIEELAQDCCAVHGAYRHAQYPARCTLAGASVGECRFLRPEPFPWIWYRPNSRNQPRFPHLHAKNFMELILVVNLGKGRLMKPGCSNVLVHDAEYGSERVHANQKPMSLYRELVERFTFTGDVVCDTFFGSGNSLAAAASLSRVAWGCDKNPQMLPFAHGKIRQYMQPITKEAVEASLRRYEQGLAMTLPEDDTGEVEVSTTPKPSGRRPGQVFQYETFRIGKEFLGYIKYDGHNLAQLRGSNEDDLQGELSEVCRMLDTAVEMGGLDPTTCTPEEVQKIISTEPAEEAS